MSCIDSVAEPETKGRPKYTRKVLSAASFPRVELVVIEDMVEADNVTHRTSTTEFVVASRSLRKDHHFRRWTGPAFWFSVVVAWVVLVGAYVFDVVRSEESGTGFIVLILFGAAVSVVWLHGLKYLASLAFYPLFRRNHVGRVPHGSGNSRSEVALLYCTANDFNPHALAQSIGQTHAALVPVILDDSTDTEVMRAIDEFATANSVDVVRRVDRSGFKAGNLNHFLTSHPRLDHFVIVDSDGVLPPNFVSRALDYFASDARIGVVQARHRAHAGMNSFTRSFAPMLESHLAVNQMARSSVGFSTFLGRGAMISVECYRASGGFPEYVLEDLCFSIEARLAGYSIAFAPDIICAEDFPVDYRAFKTQYRKVVEGTTEFMRRYLRRVITAPIRTWEKIDVIAEHSVFLVGAFLGILAFSANLVVPTLFGGGRSFAWVGVATGICAISPLLPEAARRVRARRPWSAVAFIAHASVLYGSCLLTTLRALMKIIRGNRAVFAVTPKIRRTPTHANTVASNCPELIFAAVVGILSMVATGSLVPAIALVVPAVASVYFDRLGAYPRLEAGIRSDATPRGVERADRRRIAPLVGTVEE